MEEPIAQFWAIATTAPAILALISYLFWFGRMAQRLRVAHRAVWVQLGSPSVSGLLVTTGGLKLVAWVSRQGYRSLRDDRAIALGSACRRVYFAIIAVVIWILAAIIIGPVESDAVQLSLGQTVSASQLRRQCGRDYLLAPPIGPCRPVAQLWREIDT